MKYINIVETVSNYATNSLQDTLIDYGNNGYKLVNSILAKNKYGVDVMYLFFTKELEEVPETSVFADIKTSLQEAIAGAGYETAKLDSADYCSEK